MSGTTRDGGLTIGAVLARLQPDFPDISISKIRFLESEGLISPSRTASGYRTFGSDDVARLEYILTAQRDRFWPLRVIREALDAMDRGLQPPETDLARPEVPAAQVDPSLPTAADLLAAGPAASDGFAGAASAPGSAALRLTRQEVARSCGLSEETVEALCTYGLLRPDADGHFPATALPIAEAAGALAGYGVEPRHLRPFRTAADRELGLVQQILSPLHGHRYDHRREEVTAALLRECIALHTALVKAALAQAAR